MNKVDDIKDLSKLGKKIENYKFTYNKEGLEAFENKLGNDIFVKLDAFEFTTLCPITGQPDFADIIINYVPDKYLVESKSLKMYLFGFRNEGNFHEAVVSKIMQDLIDLLDPNYIEVIGKFSARGGIAILPFVNYAKKGTKYEDWLDKRKLDYARQ